MYFKKPTLNNLSQGARLEYVRRIRHMDMDDVAEYFGFGGNDPHKTFNSYEQTEYNEIVQNVINDWQEMKDKRENYEISDEEYLEWKLNFEIINTVNQE